MNLKVKKIISMMALAAIALAVRADSITLVDETDLSPIAGATVISDNGLIVGQTDIKGKISVAKTDFPLAIRCLGFEAKTVSAHADVIKMTPATFMLGEVVVTPVDRPILRVLTYSREYCAGTFGTDTLQVYHENMLEYMLADKKVKGFEKFHQLGYPKNSRTYGRIISEGRDSLIGPDDTAPAIGQFIMSMRFKDMEVTEAIKNGASTDTVRGKHTPKFIYKSTPDMLTIEHDILADKKNQRWSPWQLKLLGMTTDILKARWTRAFRPNKEGIYGNDDMIYGTGNLHVIARGKVIKWVTGAKGAVELDCYIEQYPVVVEYLSVEEYKELTRNREKTEFEIPDYVQPPLPAAKKLIELYDREKE